MTPKYAYGGGPTPANTYAMPKLSSPSMNPASQSPVVSSMGGGGSSGHLPGHYSSSPSALAGYVSGSTPQYQNVLMPGGQQFGANPTPGALAYDPSAVAHQDSSDSDN